MSRVVVDTHVAVWALTNRRLLSAAATAALTAADTNGEIIISAITLIELTYLTEKGRLAPTVLTTVQSAIDDPTTAFRFVSIDRAITDALSQIPRAVVPDMPDRIIAATALSLGLPLVTRDTEISKLANVNLVW
ncbi:MAG: type II toxin-antitoxin system VapC family toxin [Pyrinomonadaceae bacterium]